MNFDEKDYIQAQKEYFRDNLADNMQIFYGVIGKDDQGRDTYTGEIAWNTKELLLARAHVLANYLATERDHHTPYPLTIKFRHTTRREM